MNNLKWVQKGTQLFLKDEEAVLIELLVQPMGVSTFKIGDIVYEVHKKGFFSPVYVVLNQDEKVLTLSHSFWGSEGRIVFQDGSTYTCSYSNKDVFSIRIMEGSEVLLCYSRTIIEQRFIASLSIGISMVDGDKLLILIALGAIIFFSLFRETYTQEQLSQILINTSV